MGAIRAALFWAAITIYGIAQIISGCLLGMGWFVVIGWLIWNGHGLLVVLWMVFGSLAAVLSISLIRLPFVLVAMTLAALAGRYDDFMYFARETNQG